VIVVYGDVEVAWDYIAAIPRRIKYFLDNREYNEGLENYTKKYYHHVVELVNFRSQFHDSRGPRTLLSALHASHSCLASDPRDKIFALLGITSDGSRLIPIPNYKIPIGDVLRDMTKALIKAQRSLDLICLKGMPSPGKVRVPNTASWIPDWKALWTQGATALEMDIYGSLQTTSYAQNPLLPHDDENEICCRGQYLGSISSRSTALEFTSPITISSYKASDDDKRRISWPKFSPTWFSGEASPILSLGSCLTLGQKVDCSIGDRSSSINDLHRSSVYEFLGQILQDFNDNEETSAVYCWFQENKMMSIGSKNLEMFLKGIVEGVGLGSMELRRIPYQADPLAVSEYTHFVTQVLTSSMRLVLLREGYFGMAHPDTQVGDEVWKFENCSVPMVLRPVGGTPISIVGNSAKFKVVGACYREPGGAFNGEMPDAARSGTMDVVLC
jgi:hypothetical protein